MTAVPDGLADWAAKPGPAKLLDAVRGRARRGHRTETGTLSTLPLTDQQRRDIGLLLGTPWEVSGRAPRLRDLAARLAEHDLTVLGFVELLDGHRIEPDHAVRAAKAAAAAAETAGVVATLATQGVTEPDVHAWLADPGLPRSGTGELHTLAESVALVWRALPRHGRPIRLAQLAATTHDDAHALDVDQPLGRAVARLAAVVSGLDAPRRAGRAWRRAWASVGVRCDGVSSRVLVLNLPLDGDAPAARWCGSAAGEPIWLTLRSLSGRLRTPPSISVYVCENPTVIETAADVLGTRCPAMVCTDGIASGAALDLLASIADSGGVIRYRADFDSAGFVVADQIRTAAPSAVPWRFDTATYLAALGIDVPDHPAGSLRATFARHGKPVHEERLLDALLADLTTAGRAGRGDTTTLPRLRSRNDEPDQESVRRGP